MKNHMSYRESPSHATVVEENNIKCKKTEQMKLMILPPRGTIWRVH